MAEHILLQLSENKKYREVKLESFMSKYFEDYLKRNNFKKQLNSLDKRLKNKTVIIYGTGILFQYINEHYDLSNINIIGISDMKYPIDSEGETSMGYKIIPKSSIVKYNPDYVIVAVENYFTVIENLELNLLKDTKIKLFPMVRKNLWDTISTIWNAV